MRMVVCGLLLGCALASVGCDDKKPEAKPAPTATAAAAAAKPAPAPAKTASPGGW